MEDFSVRAVPAGSAPHHDALGYMHEAHDDHASDELDDRLRLEARRRGTSIADVAREAIERQLPPAPEPGELSFFAIGDGDPRTSPSTSTSMSPARSAASARSRS